MWSTTFVLKRKALVKFFAGTIAHDKGKPVARQGRKAANLLNLGSLDCLAAEGDRSECETTVSVCIVYCARSYDPRPVLV
jgi:hypothetical protein